MSRTADSSCKAYKYQQLRMIHLIFTKYENELENNNIFSIKSFFYSFINIFNIKYIYFLILFLLKL